MSDLSWNVSSWKQEPLPWSWREKVLDFLKPGDHLLDLSPDDGEFLLSLRHPRELCFAACGQGQPEDAIKRLVSSGVKVKRQENPASLPFPDNSFDLLLDNGGPYELSEVHRVLKKSGFFLTQQRGGQDSALLRRRLLPGESDIRIDWNLEIQAPKFSKAGFRIMYRNQAYPNVRFFSEEALRGYAKKRFGSFSDRMESDFHWYEEELQKRGFAENTEHHFLIIAKKK